MLAGALGATALTFVTVGTMSLTASAAPCTSCHGDTHGEDDALVWLDQYDYELETDYAQSDPVKAGPDGQGDYRPHG